ncbi:MAG TPA: amidohydrolase [Lentisphaeria bacterium]|mgnify:FL=1|nr:amidohydrolase [Lentisphaerota bacterium]OQC12554.1 MAG: p-aminobenzoyl-glutamate hydrolase subunit B [Lentisphaerae bacterium ADurb.Bin082]HPY89247.1 amidohydrolase [Lentisphaeria bacterium]HQL88847.1 amidohydrolase [Lentisphaeria bacterium]
MLDLKNQIRSAVDASRARIIAIAEQILHHPELGYREFQASKLMRGLFIELGLPVQENLAITGCRAVLDSGRPGPTVALLGEFDALPVPTHPLADPSTGAAHACGHHAQSAALAGAAIALTASKAIEKLSGKIVFIACPAEEFQALDFCRKLIAEKKLVYCGGKAELIRTGAFDDVDVAMLIHGGSDHFSPASFNGFVMKKIVFTGKASHAGLKPQLGINALSMARQALNLIDAQRDTFDDQDSVRIHGIVTNGGAAVNVVPDRVELELQIRAKTPAAIQDAAVKVERCLQAAAMAFAGAVQVETLPGYMPFKSCPELEQLHAANLKSLAPEVAFSTGTHRGSSTDMGDVSMIIPSLHAYNGGFTGTPHSTDFLVTDPEKAYIQAAALLAMNAVDLLFGDAATGKSIAAQPTTLSREEYRKLMQETSRPSKWDYRKK